MFDQTIHPRCFFKDDLISKDCSVTEQPFLMCLDDGHDKFLLILSC